jgi:hypothetical protein
MIYLLRRPGGAFFCFKVVIPLFMVGAGSVQPSLVAHDPPLLFYIDADLLFPELSALTICAPNDLIRERGSGR